MSDNKMNPELLSLYNREVSREISSGHIYRKMSSVFQQLGLEGFAAYFLKQAEGEHKHSLKFAKLIEDRGDIVSFDEIPSVVVSNTVLELVQQAQSQEIFIKVSIDEMVFKSWQTMDYGSFEFLQYFVKEQVEEINKASLLVKQVELCEENSAGILLLDKKLGKK